MRPTYILVAATFLVSAAAVPRPDIDSVPYISRHVISATLNSDGKTDFEKSNVNEVRDIFRSLTLEAERNTNVIVQNVIVVPPNCPSGQSYINGQCRDIWRGNQIEAVKVATHVEVEDIPSIHNVVVVPPNCPTGQEYVNGQCRDIWRSNFIESVEVVNVIDAVEQTYNHVVQLQDKHELSPQNVITVPPNCPTGQEYINGQCRDIWVSKDVKVAEVANISPQKVVSVPLNCASGSQLINGQCQVWKKVIDDVSTNNVITAPDNCPSGQALVNGQCRDIWLSKQLEAANVVLLSEALDGPQMSNIITVPNQCPDGYRPDSAGVCREIW